MGIVTSMAIVTTADGLAIRAPVTTMAPWLPWTPGYHGPLARRVWVGRVLWGGQVRLAWMDAQSCRNCFTAPQVEVLE